MSEQCCRPSRPLAAPEASYILPGYGAKSWPKEVSLSGRPATVHPCSRHLQRTVLSPHHARGLRGASFWGCDPSPQSSEMNGTFARFDKSALCQRVNLYMPGQGNRGCVACPDERSSGFRGNLVCSLIISHGSCCGRRQKDRIDSSRPAEGLFPLSDEGITSCRNSLSRHPGWGIGDGDLDRVGRRQGRSVREKLDPVETETRSSRGADTTVLGHQ
jgi:hypothetical protein